MRVSYRRYRLQKIIKDISRSFALEIINDRSPKPFESAAKRKEITLCGSIDGPYIVQYRRKEIFLITITVHVNAYFNIIRSCSMRTIAIPSDFSYAPADTPVVDETLKCRALHVPFREGAQYWRVMR